MPGLIAACVIILIIAAILALKATLTIEYREALNLTVKLLFLKIKILPRKEKKVDPKDFSPRKYRRMMKRKHRKELRAWKKKQKKKQAKLEKKELAKKEKETAKKLGKGHKKGNLLDNINLIREIVSIVCARFARHLRIGVTRINIVVATDDAAKTAILYGAVAQSVAYILEALDRVTNLKYENDAEVSVDTDFLAEKPTADVCISFSLRVCHLLDVALRAIWRFAVKKAKNKNNK